MPDEQKLTKEELFQKEPESFVHLSELIIAVKKDIDDKDKISVFIGERGEFRLRGAIGILKTAVEHIIVQQKRQAAQDSKIIKGMQTEVNKGNFRNFIKGKK